MLEPRSASPTPFAFSAERRARVAVLISGRGSNMAALLSAAAAPGYPCRIVAVLSDKEEAAGLERARRAGVRAAWVDPSGGKARFEAALEAALSAAEADLICLAGFMRVLSGPFTERWRDRVLNIHPSLLPAYPGLDPHARVLAAGDPTHGCTVHLVREGVDTGPILGRRSVAVAPGDDEARLAARVLAEEHTLYPEALALWATGGAWVADDGETIVRRRGAG